MRAKEIIISLVALVSAFIGGDHLDLVEPSIHTHVISEECKVTRQIEKEM
jgi:hypothetical protein|tara:strand:+ start:282 stop:431 length:150 start_codon:yes stop_codon:yes gene_type:complete